MSHVNTFPRESSQSWFHYKLPKEWGLIKSSKIKRREIRALTCVRCNWPVVCLQRLVHTARAHGSCALCFDSFLLMFLAVHRV